MVEFNNEKIPTYKLIVHCLQVLFSLTIWCLEIVVFKYGEVNGRMGWTFGVVSRTFQRNPSPPFFFFLPRAMSRPNLLTQSHLRSASFLSQVGSTW